MSTMRDDELLRLVTSDLPLDELAAEVTRLVVQQAEEQEPEWGGLLRAAAIPRRLDAAVIGVLRDAPDDEAGNQAALQRLAGYSLVLPDPEGRSYALHEEVRAVLLADWQAPQQRTRYVELNRALYNHALAADQGREALYHHFAFDPGGAFAEFEGRFANAHKFYRRAECGALLAAVKEQERELDPGQRLWLRYYQGRLAWLLDRWAEAEEGYRELLADLSPLPTEGEEPGPALSPVLSEVEGEVEGERGGLKLRNWTLHDLGKALDRQGKWAEAVEVYQEALKGDRELGDRHREGRTLNNLGIVYQPQGRWEQAIECYEASLRIFRELGDRHGEGITLNNLGNVYQAQGRWEQAIECYEACLRIFRELGYRYGEGLTLGNLGRVYRAQGRWEQAIECYQQARDILHELSDRSSEHKIIGDRGVIYLRQGQWQKARTALDKALQIAQELGNRPDAAQYQHYLGEWHKGQGQLDEAIAHYEEALAIRREMKAWPHAGETLHALAEVYTLRGDWAKAAEMAEQAAAAWRRAAERGRISAYTSDPLD